MMMGADKMLFHQKMIIGKSSESEFSSVDGCNLMKSSLKPIIFFGS